jgi:hypothetical protein
VRWCESGKRPLRRFVDEAEAREFAATVSPTGGQDIARDVKRGDGLYVYETKDGPRYRFSFRQADGTLSTRRGFGDRHRRWRPRVLDGRTSLVRGRAPLVAHDDDDGGLRRRNPGDPQRYSASSTRLPSGSRT